MAPSRPFSKSRPAGRPKHARQAPRREGDAPDDGSVRLQRAMASAGVGSRRHCEELITSGRVSIGGQTVTELGTKVLPHQQIAVDGVVLTRSRLTYYMVNKPMGVVSTNDDPSGRPRVVDLLPATKERLFTVGRLDMSSEGLILLTNDGELANRLAHPRYEVEKTYQVVVAGTPDKEIIETLRGGIRLAEGLARAISVRIKKSLKLSTVIEIVLSEGKNREIRRLLAKVGHKVLRLKRIAIAGLRLGELPPGEFRRLTNEEVRGLKNWRPPKAELRERKSPLGARVKQKAISAKDPAVAAPPRTAARRVEAKPARQPRVGARQATVIGAGTESRPAQGIEKGRRRPILKKSGSAMARGQRKGQRKGTRD